MKKLITFKTVNPPGNEKECIDYINQLLIDHGLKPKYYSKDKNRPNLILRYKGKNSNNPLLLYGHIDVYAANEKDWKYPPFEGIEKEGYIWGRGAVDMKSIVAIFICAILHLKTNNIIPENDIILAVLSDEEQYGIFGAKYLVHEHPKIFKDVKYAISETGGISLFFRKKKYYPIQISEKNHCFLEIIIKGKGGHSMIIPDKENVVLKTCKIIKQLYKIKLPIHKLKENQITFKILFKHSFPILKYILKLPFIFNLLIRKNIILKKFFCNSFSITKIKSDNEFNTIPDEIKLYLDCRLLPGIKPEYFLKEISRVISKYDIETNIIDFVDNPIDNKFDNNFYNILDNIITELDPDGIPTPIMSVASSDASYFSEIGIRTYGFTPLNCPEDFVFFKNIHGSNERIPADALEGGLQGIIKLIKYYK